MQPLKYPGGKHYLRKKIWELAKAIPHKFRGIPCGGGLSEFWEWPHQGVSECVNDLDRSLVNLWRVWQSQEKFEEFRRQVEAIPVGREHFLEAVQTAKQGANGSVEAAVALFVRLRQSMMGLGKSWAPLSKSRTRRGMNEQASAWLTAVEGLPEVHQRLQGVVLENVDVLDFVRRYDGAATLFYIDPPYAPETRCDNLYGQEMSLEKHQDLLTALTDKGLKSSVILSGYDCPLYLEKLVGWTKTEVTLKSAMTKSKDKPDRTECLWTNRS